MQLEPGAIVENRYRIERLVASHTGVTVWDATDLLQACTVELVLSHGGTMIDVATIPRRAPQPVLELVEISDEDAFFDEPPPPDLYYTPPPPPRSRALWLLGVAAIGCAAIGAGVLYTKYSSARTIAANEEVTITRAELPLRATETPPPPLPAAIVKVDAPLPAPTPPPRAIITPKRLPRPAHRVASPTPPPQRPPPPHQEPQQQQEPPPLPAHDDPITL